MRLLSAVALGLFLASACHSASRQSRPVPEGRDPYLILASELEASPRTNLYDAVWELRPRWFTRSTRGTGSGEVLVYIEDQLLGTAGTLRRFHIGQVSEVRYLSGTEAQVRYGQSNRGRPAILVTLARS
jgi:hypothetical protein